MSVGSCDGRLIVAMPMLEDPNFERTVVLVLDHDEDGALGIVLNRPTTTVIGEVMAGWEVVVAEPACVFGGGPVEPRAVVGLAIARQGLEPGHTITQRIRTIDPTADPDELRLEVEGARIFAGYAGWAPGQLEEEVEEGAWVVVDAEPDDVVGPNPTALWATVLARQPGEDLRLLASFPNDPRLN